MLLPHLCILPTSLSNVIAVDEDVPDTHNAPQTYSDKVAAQRSRNKEHLSRIVQHIQANI
jgi:hypothetical protein